MDARLQKQAGFTQIEVLVVIGLLIVLAALLLPAVLMVKNHALAAKCLGNMRNYGIAVLAYAGDNDGLPYWNGTTDRSDGSVYPQYYLWLSNKGYLPASPVRCPLATSDELKNPFGFHYAGNAALNNFYHKLRGIPAPASRVILASEYYHLDGFWTASHMNTTYNGSPGASPPRREQRHGSGMHCFFLDGHVELVSPKDGDWSHSPTYGNATNGGYFFTSDHFSRMKEGRLEVQ